MADAVADLRLQVLRTIDKRDRLGDLGVFNLLTTGRTDASGAITPGCGLTNGQAMGIVGFLHAGKDSLIDRRLQLVDALEGAVIDAEGRTAWDALLDMRPANIGWALDDLWEAIARSADRPALSQPQEAEHE